METETFNGDELDLTGKENLLEVYGLLDDFNRLRKIDKSLPIERDKLISLKRKYFEPRSGGKITYTGLNALALEVLTRSPSEIDISYLKPLSDKDLQEGFVLTDAPVPKKRKKDKKRSNK